MRRRTPWRWRGDGAAAVTPTTATPVLERPRDPARENRALAPPSQVMYIMADLGSGDPALAGLPASATPLVAVRADGNGTLTVQPDFGPAFHRVETLHGDVFEYCVDLAAPAPTPESAAAADRVRDGAGPRAPLSGAARLPPPWLALRRRA
jgi:hypothetical protein